MGEGDIPPCPKSIFYELMDFTYTLAEKFNVLPFEIFRQDKDEVVMLINYFVEKGDETHEETHEQRKETHDKSKVKRVRVNDKTATGGWF